MASPSRRPQMDISGFIASAFIFLSFLQFLGYR